MAEQRYTPVPGMGRPATHEMSQVGGSRSSGYGDENYFYEEGAVPAAHRFSYTDSPSRSASSSRLQPDAMQQTHHNPFSSNYDTPLAGGAALGAGAGAGLAAGAATTTSRGPQMSERGAAYQNIPSEQYWGDFNAATASSGYVDHAAMARRNRMWKIGGIIFAILAVIAIVVGVVVSQVTKKSSNGSGSSSGSSSGNGTEADIGSDPSKFDKDSRLHQSFWAMAYTPQGAILPNCATNQANVTKDIQLLSQLTTRLRLYGANCNATAVVLQAIQDTKVDMTIWPAIYIDSNTQAYTDQVAAIKDAIEKYGTDHIEGIIVGNEYILNMAGTDSTTSSAYLSAAQDIMDHIQEVNTTIKGMSLNKHLPIGTSDAGSVLSTTLATGIDFFMANVHPWFATQPVSTAADWTYNFFHEFDVDVAATAPNNPACYIAETGWPTGTSNATEGNNGAASPGGDASLANLQTFMDTFVCQANANGTEYFYFEAFDEPWKEIYGGVEPHWGLFDSDRNLKDVTIPTCS